MDHAEARPREATPRPRSGAVTESARLCRHRSSREELPHVQGRGSGRDKLPDPRGQGWQQRQATACPSSGQWTRRATTGSRSGEAAERSNPTSKERRLRRHWRAKRSYFTFKVRRRSRGCSLPLIQGQEQQLRSAGAALKRYPTSKVRKTQVRG